MISKIIFALVSYEFLATLEGKLERAYSFRVQSGKITVCNNCNVKVKTNCEKKYNLAFNFSLFWAWIRIGGCYVFSRFFGVVSIVHVCQKCLQIDLQA